MRPIFRNAMLFWVFSVALGVTSISQSAPPVPHQEAPIMLYGGSGSDLLDRCNSAPPKVGDRIDAGAIKTVSQSNRCWGYIAGVVDAYEAVAGAGLLNTPQMFCLPDKVTFGQLEKVVRKNLEDNPAHLHEPAAALVLSALRDAYPCRP